MIILVIDDDASICKFLKTAIEALGHTCHAVQSPREAQSALADITPDLALIDLYLKESSGLDLLQLIRGDCKACAVVMMTAHATVETVTQSLRAGAEEYLGKPVRIDDLLDLIRRFEKRQAEVRPEALPWVPSTIVGNSEAMLKVYRLVARVAPSDASVLLLGPSGSGKELVARAVHAHSRRSKGPFIPINCGALPEHILDNELFGHERGAFTGADAASQGLFEAAERGTIFLDEISETSLAMQVKLLRVLQEGEIRRLGSHKNIDIDVRVIAAANKALGPLMQEGTFREDLYYRLAVVSIAIPALSERVEDIPLLAQRFVEKANERNRRDAFLTQEALQKLLQLPWPGNVRELENVVERLVIFSITDEISGEDVQRAYNHTSYVSPNGIGGPKSLKEVERDQIVKVLNESNGNRSLAAKRLGIERKTLYMKAKRLGIEFPT